MNQMMTVLEKARRERMNKLNEGYERDKIVLFQSTPALNLEILDEMRVTREDIQNKPRYQKLFAEAYGDEVAEILRFIRRLLNPEGKFWNYKIGYEDVTWLRDTQFTPYSPLDLAGIRITISQSSDVENAMNLTQNRVMMFSLEIMLTSDNSILYILSSVEPSEVGISKFMFDSIEKVQKEISNRAIDLTLGKYFVPSDYLKLPAKSWFKLDE